MIKEDQKFPWNLIFIISNPKGWLISLLYILTLYSCKQSLYVGSKVNWKKKSACSWIWCQRICLPVCNNIYFLLSMGIKNCMKNLMTLNDQKCYILVGHNSTIFCDPLFFWIFQHSLSCLGSVTSSFSLELDPGLLQNLLWLESANPERSFLDTF